MTHSPGHVVTEKNTYGKVADRRPAARDGHSGIIHEIQIQIY